MIINNDRFLKKLYHIEPCYDRPKWLNIHLNMPYFVLLPGGGVGPFFPYPEHISSELTLPLIVHGNFCKNNCNWGCAEQELKPCLKALSPEQIIATLEKLP